jgi:hypothetical protein
LNLQVEVDRQVQSLKHSLFSREIAIAGYGRLIGVFL